MASLVSDSKNDLDSLSKAVKNSWNSCGNIGNYAGSSIP